jgi:nucleotide-binding universal stress UspA family protein
MRDLLVYLDDTPASPPRLEAALALAGRLGARLTALCLVAEPYLRGAGGRHLPADLIREHLAHAEAAAEAVLAAAREAAGRHGTALETRREAGSLDRLPQLLARHARHADLTVVGRANAEVGGAEDALLAEAAFMDSGRPALVVPPPGDGGADGVSAWSLPSRRAVVAWDGSREAARAAGDAVPLLRLAGEVLVLVVDGRDAAARPGERPGAGIAAHLARHEVRAEVREVASDGAGSVGEAILARARDEGADLVVMGGYGHSRLREMMLGGTTRHVLERTTVPVLLSH